MRIDLGGLVPRPGPAWRRPPPGARTRRAAPARGARLRPAGGAGAPPAPAVALAALALGRRRRPPARRPALGAPSRPRRLRQPARRSGPAAPAGGARPGGRRRRGSTTPGRPVKLAVVAGPVGAPSMPRLRAAPAGRARPTTARWSSRRRGGAVAAVGPRATAEITRALRAGRVGRIADPVARLARGRRRRRSASPPIWRPPGALGAGPDPDRRSSGGRGRRPSASGARSGADPAGDDRGPRPAPASALDALRARAMALARRPRPAARGAPRTSSTPWASTQTRSRRCRRCARPRQVAPSDPACGGSGRDRGRRRGRERARRPRPIRSPASAGSTPPTASPSPRPARRDRGRSARRAARRSRPASPRCRGCSSRTAPPCPSTPRATGRCCGRTRPHERDPPVVWVCIPTYDEAENVERMAASLSAVFAREGIDGHVLVIDDGSPDGTGAIADRLAAADPRVHVLHRAAKSGIGPAYRAGFRAALAAGADLVVEMDCDFSHDPDDVAAPRGGGRGRRPRARLALRRRRRRWRDWGLVRAPDQPRRLLVRAHDPRRRRSRDLTGRLQVLPPRGARGPAARRGAARRGYGFQIEMTYRALRAGLPGGARCRSPSRDRELGALEDVARHRPGGGARWSPACACGWGRGGRPRRKAVGRIDQIRRSPTWRSNTSSEPTSDGVLEGGLGDEEPVGRVAVVPRQVGDPQPLQRAPSAAAMSGASRREVVGGIPRPGRRRRAPAARGPARRAGRGGFGARHPICAMAARVRSADRDEVRRGASPG